MTDDTNRRVADACGFDVANHLWQCAYIRESEESAWWFFDPLRDERHAVLAAEKFGLFQERNCCLTQINSQWTVMRGETILGSGTFCDAIVRAILKLHEINSST